MDGSGRDIDVGGVAGLEDAWSALVAIEFVHCMCKLQMRVGQTPFECYFVAELKLDSLLALSENSTAVLQPKRAPQGLTLWPR